ncbi:MAG: alpha-glucosidase [Rothia sp. (in: high G+C Gram-positive bacteria)]|uniref:glycoside hydrolase family 13 protein n=1 Tax=Rothia sp. (in: high G+C Gram-positive bacteria) TaxID=1885016 RepID=UPI0026E03E58|nr:alpha-glucosidase [Rothia sp. (in: high G+C Gram-positive bacteria)]MDO5750012.1 alpha-glucosidase [Rothia sp. (in: high G+C Gram-positive bacteria)]
MSEISTPSYAGKQWWKEAVVYQVYPRSFADANGDGIGDLKGITAKLPYLQKLGINVIWLSPVFDSPNVDNGYDISDYFAIMGDFGTMEDFDELLETAHNHGIKILMDLVANHTSDQHPWFVQSKSSRENPYRDYYIWKDPKGFEEDGTPIPPNNWASEFGGSAWEWDENTQQFYLHIFFKEQPDLNWENPRVREDLYSMVRWWLDKGVDGFRLDAINIISKPEGYPDDPDTDFEKHTSSIPFVIAHGTMVHPWMKELNAQSFGRYDVMTVGETSQTSPEDAKLWAGYDAGELQMIFHFDHMGVDTDPEGSLGGKWSYAPYKLSELKRILNAWQTELEGNAWGSLYWNNHDQPRVVSRFGNDSPQWRVKSAKQLATTLHFMQGTPYIYQGEELGMTNVRFESIDEYRDGDSIRFYQDMHVERGNLSHEDAMRAIYIKGRDNARTPMHWDASAHAGFSFGKDVQPWISVNPNFAEINADAALADENSIFYHYQQLVSLRRGELKDLMVYGSFKPLDVEDEQVYAYERVGGAEGTDASQSLLVISNFSEQELERHYEALEQAREAGASVELVHSNYADDQGATLRPYEAKVYRISR